MTEGLFRSDQKVAGPEASGDPNQVHPSSPDIVRPKLTGIWLGPRLFINQSSRTYSAYRNYNHFVWYKTDSRRTVYTRNVSRIADYLMVHPEFLEQAAQHRFLADE